ncbi:hypothetical protein GCM10008910_31470 [Faecalicatena orotica]|uniref:TetR family transcriptional regulator n=1 Tax=Faecalicatena orotica TaxID=1544 RepID=A0A2Y9BJA8_9FIRM|nr:hypothetical protein [Faecalicatena orotica]PWJ22686.1 hypothetical protein A8806_11726 [Faecalicatena orotica]SSA58129.1 hypothetical protein SAMN05216536_11726 [Faecalicatena orotica]
MPTEKFIHLELHKRNAILKGACMAIADSSCYLHSGSKLAARMQISESDFDSYFYDMRDLLCCLLYYLFDRVLDDFLLSLQAEGGNFQEACIRNIREMKKTGKWELYASICERFVYETYYQRLAAYAAERYYETGKITKFIETCHGMLDPARYGALEQEKLKKGMKFVLDIVLYGLVTCEADDTDEEWEALLCRVRSIGQGLERLSSE